MAIAISGTTGITLATQFDSASNFGFKNRIINGQMQIAQRATSGTSGAAAPTTSPTYPSVDRFYAYATGATVTVAQVAGASAVKNNLQVTGAASVTAVGIGQRIEQLNSYDLAGSTCTISANISNSLLTTVTWTASYATSADTWSAKTQIATGSFTVTSTLTNYSAQISVPAAATTGIEILFTVGAQTSGTWVIGNVQLEKGSTATSFDYRSYGTELALCQRYCFVPASNSRYVGQCDATTRALIIYIFPQTMRSGPSATLASASTYNVTNATGSTVAGTAVSLSGGYTDVAQLGITVASGLNAGDASLVTANGTTIFSAEL